MSASEAPAAAIGYEFPTLATGPVVTTSATAAERAAEIVARAEARATSIAEEAAARGHAEGYAAGLADARERLDPAVAALAEAVSAVDASAAERADLVEHRAVELGLALAEKVVSSALGVRPELVLDVIAGLLRGVSERDRITLVVNPDDLDLVREAATGLAAGLGGFGRVEVIGERRVGRGGAIVHTADGEIDGTVETQLARAAEAVRDVIAHD